MAKPPPTTTAEPPQGRGYTKQLEEMNGLAKVERLRRLDSECSHSIHATGIFTYATWKVDSATPMYWFIMVMAPY